MWPGVNHHHLGMNLQHQPQLSDSRLVLVEMSSITDTKTWLNYIQFCTVKADVNIDLRLRSYILLSNFRRVGTLVIEKVRQTRKLEKSEGLILD